MVSGQSERSTQGTWNHKRGVFDYCHTKKYSPVFIFLRHIRPFGLLGIFVCIPLHSPLFPPGPGTHAPPRAWCGTGSAPPPCPRGAARPKPRDRSPATRGGGGRGASGEHTRWAVRPTDRRLPLDGISLRQPKWPAGKRIAQYQPSEYGKPGPWGGG